MKGSRLRKVFSSLSEFLFIDFFLAYFTFYFLPFWAWPHRLSIPMSNWLPSLVLVLISYDRIDGHCLLERYSLYCEGWVGSLIANIVMGIPTPLRITATVAIAATVMKHLSCTCYSIECRRCQTGLSMCRFAERFAMGNWVPVSSSSVTRIRFHDIHCMPGAN